MYVATESPVQSLMSSVQSLLDLPRLLVPSIPMSVQKLSDVAAEKTLSKELNQDSGKEEDQNGHGLTTLPVRSD